MSFLIYHLFSRLMCGCSEKCRGALLYIIFGLLKSVQINSLLYHACIIYLHLFLYVNLVGFLNKCVIKIYNWRKKRGGLLFTTNLPLSLFYSLFLFPTNYFPFIQLSKFFFLCNFFNTFHTFLKKIFP